MRLLIVDDHPVVVAGCKALFAGRADFEMFDVHDGELGVAAFFDLRADLGLIDINLPGISGFEVIRRIVERDPAARLIAFSMNSDPSVANRAIEVGARAYLTKSDPPERFIAATEALMAGETYLSPDMATEIAFLRAKGADALSRREIIILHGVGAGKSLYDLAKELGVSYKTAAASCATLKLKLGARNTQDLVRFALEKQRM